MIEFYNFIDSFFAIPWIRILMAFTCAITVVWLLIPPIVRVAQKGNIVCETNARTSHTGSIPRLGGIAIFFGLVISTLYFTGSAYLVHLQFVIVGLLIIFLVGIKDDINNLNWRYKLAGQILACLVVIIPGHYYFTTVHGFMGFAEISPWVGIPLTLFVMIVLINSFNLIDGIDGLAAGIGITILLSFGVWFGFNRHVEETILCAGGVGALAAFLQFNLFSKKYKIFMGDGGSLMLGYIFSYLVIRFNEVAKSPDLPFPVYGAPAVAIGVLALPLYDTIRVFFIRTLRRQSPFHADKKHLHHMFLKLGFTHIQATMVLAGFNLVCVGVAFSLDWYFHSVIKLILCLLLMWMIFSEVLNQAVERKKDDG